MSMKHYIWVAVWGNTVIGFDPQEIATFDLVYRIKLEPLGLDYWACFNDHFDDVLEGYEAYAYSTIWHDPVAWKQ